MSAKPVGVPWHHSHKVSPLSVALLHPLSRSRSRRLSLARSLTYSRSLSRVLPRSRCKHTAHAKQQLHARARSRLYSILTSLPQSPKRSQCHNLACFKGRPPVFLVIATSSSISLSPITLLSAPGIYQPTSESRKRPRKDRTSSVPPCRVATLHCRECAPLPNASLLYLTTQ